MKRDFTEIFCIVDDFIKNCDEKMLTIESSKNKPGPKGSLNISEIVTIIIGFHNSGADCFKNYYNMIILKDHQEDFALA